MVNVENDFVSSKEYCRCCLSSRTAKVGSHTNSPSASVVTGDKKNAKQKHQTLGFGYHVGQINPTILLGLPQREVTFCSLKEQS